MAESHKPHKYNVQLLVKILFFLLQSTVCYFWKDCCFIFKYFQTVVKICPGFMDTLISFPEGRMDEHTPMLKRERPQ